MYGFCEERSDEAICYGFLKVFAVHSSYPQPSLLLLQQKKQKKIEITKKKYFFPQNT